MSPVLRVVSLLACMPVLVGCGSTEGSVVTIEVVLEAPSSPSTFTTNTGWEVRLDEARIAMGPLFAFAPRFDGSAIAAIRSFLLPVARAHGGTDPLNGRISAEPLLLGAVEAESGLVDAVTVTLNPPGSDQAAILHGHHLWVRGEATKDSTSIRFEGGLDIPDEGLSRRVENVPIDAFLEEGGRWVVSVHASQWFQDAQFDRLTEQDGEGVFLITPESQVRSAWFLGARSTRAYAARFEMEEEE